MEPEEFMKALWDGLFVLRDHWQLVLGILSLIFAGQSLIYAMMKSIFGHGLTEEEYFSLGMAGWILPASLFSLLWFGLRIIRWLPSSSLIFTILFLILAGLFFFPIKKHSAPISKATGISLLFLFCGFILLRLAFISHALIPPYFDSVRHYTIINSLLEHSEPEVITATFPWLGTNYYHVGFHFLAAFVASSMEPEIPKTMLMVGQMILAITPLSVFFLIKHETQSNRAGIFAVLLGGIGWSMPAYAVNWGKYPAVTSLILLQFVLSLAYLAAQKSKVLATHQKRALCVLLLSGIILAGFFHSRSLVVIGIAFIAWITAQAWGSLGKPTRVLLGCLLVLGILFEILFIQKQEVLAPLFEPYGLKGFLVTFTVVCLSFFAMKTYPKLTVSNLIGIFLLLGSLFIPTLEFISRFANLTLLDRTFVEIILYLPLSLLGGLGLAGLEQTLRETPARLGKLTIPSASISLAFITLILGNALVGYDFYPSDCCTIVGRDDLTAMDWMSKNLPSDVRILISANELIVQASGTLQGYAPADAGAWITPLTSQTTIPWRYDTNLGKEKKFKSLCKLGIDYIYIGSTGLSFHAPRLRAHPEWYRALFTRSRTEVYQVIGCT
jgi:hypothetical protein